MKAEDLRVGNYYIDYGGKIMAVDLNFFNLLWLDVDVDEIIKEFIPLTEEWLLKLGFYGEEYFKRRNGIVIKKTYDGYALIGEKYAIGKDLQYVHQLQNLYFALTGEELQIIS